MLRCTLLSLSLLSLSSCASQPICRPWSPEPAALAVAPAQAPAAPAAAPAALPDDGTTPLAEPATDEVWLSVVGDAAPRPRAAQARPAALRTAARGDAPTRMAPAPARPTRPAMTPAQRAAAIAAWPTTELMNAEPAAARPAAPAAARTARPAKPGVAVAAVEPTKAAPTAPAAPVAKVAKKPDAAPAAAASPAARGEAKKFFAGRCVMCHGEAGRGDGPTGKTLTPPPRNFTDKAWQAAVTDAHIEKVIQNGGPSVGKSPLMPPHGDLSPELLRAMRQLVREFGR